MLDDRSYMREGRFANYRSATVIILIINVVVFFLQTIPFVDRHFALNLGDLQRGHVWQLLTFQFLHGGLMHLLFNSLAIWFFGRAIEQEWGPQKFLVLYLGSGVVGGLLQMFVSWAWPGHFGVGSVVGASAGAFGVVAAFALLHPEQPLTLLFAMIIPISMKAKFLLLIQILIALYGLLNPGDGIAHAAHLGGILAGVAAVRFGLPELDFSGLWNRPALRARRPQLVGKGASKGGSSWASGDAEVDDSTPDEFISRQVDPILEKISAHGIHSLTEHERKILEAARAKMDRR